MCGFDILFGVYNMFDFMLKGWNEGDNIMGWVWWYDEYMGVFVGELVVVSV